LITRSTGVITLTVRFQKYVIESEDDFMRDLLRYT